MGQQGCSGGALAHKWDGLKRQAVLATWSPWPSMNLALSSQVMLATEVFETVASRLVAKAEDIALFTSTQYSFEEWLNWEAWAGCSSREAWEVKPKPRYPDAKYLADLEVIDHRHARRVIVEIGLAHDGTGDKWRAKLDRDMEKLSRLSDADTLHLIVLVSTGTISSSKTWADWLAKVTCWQRPRFIEKRTDLPPNGEMVVRGWVH